MKASVYIATSLDGFIARPDGDIDWLGEPSKDGEDYGYQKFIDTVDFLVMGRNTYEKVLSFGQQWPYSKPVVVLTSRLLKVPDELAKSVETMSGSPADVVDELSKRGVEHLYVDGGKTIQTFLNADLIQRIIITRIPVLLGEGIPLFGPLNKDIRLMHVETRAFADGIVQCEYEVGLQTASA
jgi:dihydrofolate reductase